MQEPKVVSSFYKYVKIGNAPEFASEHLEFCKSLQLKGRIMIGEEGINGCVYGAKNSVEKYKQKLKSMPIFSDVEFKEQETGKPAYRKLFVRLRGEIVNFGLNVDLKNKGKYLTPAQLKRLLDKNEDVTLVDMRNDYEAEIGRFKNARILSMQNFRDLPKAIDEIKDIKNKKIVTYCTGGIRCEKASAYLREMGFSNVMQLKGGILKFGEEFPDTYWEGKCFVFDDRIAIGINRKNSEPLNECVWCKKKCDEYLNCHNIDCDKLFICCHECSIKHNSSCSGDCSNSPKRRKEYAAIIGVDSPTRPYKFAE